MVRYPVPSYEEQASQYHSLAHDCTYLRGNWNRRKGQSCEQGTVGDRFRQDTIIKALRIQPGDFLLTLSFLSTLWMRRYHLPVGKFRCDRENTLCRVA